MPLSSTARSITMPIAAMLLLLNKANYAYLLAALRVNSVRMSLILFGLVTLGLFLGIATWHEKLIVYEKYLKLLFFPVLLVGFRHASTRRYAQYAFIAAMLITTVVMLFKATGLTHYGGIDPGRIFHNHILTGFMLDLAVFLSASLAMKGQGLKRMVFFALALLFSYTVIFVCTGRMAYIAYCIMMTVWFFQSFSMKKALICVVVFISLFAFSYQYNTMMRFLVNQAFEDIQKYQHSDKNTSLGLRIQFHQYVRRELMKNKPILGHGTGGFSANFAKDEPVKGWAQKVIWEPHSQYWLIAAEYGFVGLALFVLFIVALLRESILPDTNSGLAFAVILSFAVGCFSDSLLLYSGTGYFFILFIAMSHAPRLKSSNSSYTQADAKGARLPLSLLAKASETQT